MKLSRNASTYTQKVSFTNTYCCNGSGSTTDNSECCQVNAAAIQDISAHLVVVDNFINFVMNIGDLSGITALILDISQNVYDNSRSIIEVNQEVDGLSSVVLDLSGDHNTLNTAFLDLSGKVVTNTTNIATKVSKTGDTMTGLVVSLIVIISLIIL